MIMVKKAKGEINVTTKVQKWGNSLAVRIPKVVTGSVQIEEGTEITISVENEIIKIVPTRKKPTLEELMAQITPENQHSEMDWGQSEGNEVW
jgi:antitoxin MazE